MITKKEIIELIFKSIAEINQQNDIEIIISENTKLYGRDSELDSIGLVNLITTIEEKIEEITGKYITIADERAFSQESSPFKTVNSLANYIEKLLHE